jgi:hypothetical protein
MRLESDSRLYEQRGQPRQGFMNALNGSGAAVTSPWAEQSVHNRTPFLLGFSVRLPSWRLEGGAGNGGGWAGSGWTGDHRFAVWTVYFGRVTARSLLRDCRHVTPSRTASSSQGNVAGTIRLPRWHRRSGFQDTGTGKMSKPSTGISIRHPNYAHASSNTAGFRGCSQHSASLPSRTV